MVFVRHAGQSNAILVGPWTSSGQVTLGGEAEILWVKFKMGSFMPHLPTRSFRDTETVLPESASQSSFWLKSSIWQFPNFENVEIFVDRLARQNILVNDPIVQESLRGHSISIASRTLRYRFLQVTGLSQNQIFQYQRALKAAALLENGLPILDAVFEAGYYDQPHLTRSLKHWVGRTPAQISQVSAG